MSGTPLAPRLNHLRDDIVTWHVTQTRNIVLDPVSWYPWWCSVWGPDNNVTLSVRTSALYNIVTCWALPCVLHCTYLPYKVMWRAQAAAHRLLPHSYTFPTCVTRWRPHGYPDTTLALGTITGMCPACCHQQPKLITYNRCFKLFLLRLEYVGLELVQAPVPVLHTQRGALNFTFMLYLWPNTVRSK